MFSLFHFFQAQEIFKVFVQEGTFTIFQALGKMEKQRQRRLARQKQWEDLMKEKPSDDYEDPRDVAEIKFALENMGDFKLKTAANYVVPEHLRMNTARKLVQLATLQEEVLTPNITNLF